MLLISKDVFLQKKKKKKSKDVISKSYKTTKVKINTIKPIKKRVNEILKCQSESQKSKIALF